ncbi:DUF934 domain-containing protein [Lacibacterium aquatile]|uniref:DUF934 domain-containing protein n=1 Tax=Lacibacterium aquatile TaxID=1168082 RepID=A0ABW5DQW2_9PROT
MPLVKNGALVDDIWVRPAEGEAFAPDAAVLLPADRIAEADGHQGPLGILWPNTKPVDELAPLLPRLSLIALHWPIFRDGRAYTQARLLRQRLGYKGEIRATGNILQDQLIFLARCGIDSFDLVKQADAEAASEVFKRFHVFYQAVDTARPTVFEQRKARLKA